MPGGFERTSSVGDEEASCEYEQLDAQDRARAAAAAASSAAQAAKRTAPMVGGWVAVTLLAVAAVMAAVRPRGCGDVHDCARSEEQAASPLSGYLVCALATAFLLEVVSLQLTWLSAGPLRGLVQGLDRIFVPPLLLCMTFLVLIIENICIEGFLFVHAAAPGVGGESSRARPVYSPIYAEWLVNVPILLVLSGRFALSRPWSEVTRPVVVTNLYIVLSWAAFFIHQPALRWAAIAVAFAMYGWASVDMARWVTAFRAVAPEKLPGRTGRCSLAYGLIAVFFVYGMVYLAAQVGLVSTGVELQTFLVLNIGSKLNILLVFVGIRSSQFYDLLVDLLANKRVHPVGAYGIADTL